jgi:general secretion pathway protein K
VPRSAKYESGFALVFVLWIALLFAILENSLLREARSASVGASADAAAYQATLAADGGINRAILTLIDTQDPLHWDVNGSPKTIQLFGQTVTVRVESQKGKIDLNYAPESLLAALFVGQGLSAADSLTLADRIIAWRSPVPPGAMDSTANIYRDAGRLYGPRHGRFRATGELRMVLGMTDELQAAVEPAITVYSDSAAIDRGVAHVYVLRILKASGDNFASAQLDAIQNGNAAGGDRLPATGEVVAIFAKAKTRGALAERVAIIRLKGDPNSPYTILDWR